MNPIHLFVPAFRVEETLEAVRECLETGWTGLGYKTLAIEEAWRQYTGLPHAHFLNSATGGLHLALRLFRNADGWQDGDEVITTPFTFVSTSHVILHERLTPVFADIDEWLCLDPASIEARMTSRTRAVLFVGIGGNTGRLAEVADLCRRHHLRLILDAAHMAGTRWHGRHVGGESDASVFSFHAVKNLPTADAGMLCVADARLDEEARKLSWLGISKDTYSRTVERTAYQWEYDVEHAGFKYHGNSIMAAMALVGLKYLDQDNAYRRHLAHEYDQLLTTVVERVPVAAGCESSRHLYQILVDDRDATMVALNARQIFPGVHYRSSTSYRMYQGAARCPRAAEASRRVISLPLHLKLTRDDVARVSASVAAIVGKPQTV